MWNGGILMSTGLIMCVNYSINKYVTIVRNLQYNLFPDKSKSRVNKFLQTNKPFIYKNCVNKYKCLTSSIQ